MMGYLICNCENLTIVELEIIWLWRISGFVAFLQIDKKKLFCQTFLPDVEFPAELGLIR